MINQHMQCIVKQFKVLQGDALPENTEWGTRYVFLAWKGHVWQPSWCVEEEAEIPNLLSC
jgi:hypothetical protein